MSVAPKNLAVSRLNSTGSTATRQTTIEVRNPVDGSLVGEVPNDSADTVVATARELRLFQPEWEAVGARGRMTWLLKFQEWVLDIGRGQT